MPDHRWISRRKLLQNTGIGFGSVALAHLLQASGALGATSEIPNNGSSLAPRPGNFAPRAKTVIQLVQNGGPSQMDLFDPKPELQKRNGQKHTSRSEPIYRAWQRDEPADWPARSSSKSAASAAWISRNALVTSPSIADDICLVRSMYTEHNNHTEALIMFGDRQDLSRPADHGRVDQLCAGHRKPESAGLHRAARSGRLQHQRDAELGQRLAAGALCGTEIQHARRAGAEPEARRSRCPMASRRTSLALLAQAERGASHELSARVGPGSAHPQLRIGGADAADRRRSAGSLQRDRRPRKNFMVWMTR